MSLAVVIPLICLTLAAVGLAGLLAGWLLRWKALARLRVPFLALLAAALLLLVSCAVRGVGDARFWEAEFQLTFQDPLGNPIHGIELRVEDPDGRNYFHYPVDDY